MGIFRWLFGQNDRNGGKPPGDPPANPEPQEPPHTDDSPTTHHDASHFGLMAGLNLLTLPFGFMVLPMLGNEQEIEDTIAQDMPIPFGPGMAWLAIKSTATAKVAASLQLGSSVVNDPQWRRDAVQKPAVRESTWVQGIEAANVGLVYVTPPLGEWTLAVSISLFPDSQPAEFIKPLLESLSKEFGEAQFFCTREGEGHHAWAKARNGRFARGYCEWNDPARSGWSEGVVTKQEAALNIRFQTADSTAANPQTEPADEGVVFQLASYWSIDPSSLDEHFKEPVLGLLGDGFRPASN